MPALASPVGSGRRRRTISEINMVPFIDVMLVLLIIFMVTAPLIAPSAIDLPSVGKAAKAPDQVIVITIGKDEALSIKRLEQTMPINFKDLAGTVQAMQTAYAQAKATPSLAVVISADKSVRYEAVVKVMDALQRAGVQRVGLSVQLSN
jgi:biopolymer transport protein TolR